MSSYFVYHNKTILLSLDEFMLVRTMVWVIISIDLTIVVDR
jgi:hypothetical protein